MAIVTFTLNNVLDPSREYPYIDYYNKYVAFAFKEPADVEMLQINGVNIANIYTLPTLAYSADPNDASKYLFNWSTLNNKWMIPTSGVSKYMAKFTFLAENYYVIFGLIDAEGNAVLTQGAGAPITITLDPGATNPVIFTEAKVEGLPTMQPCFAVRKYYNDDGIISISI